MASPQATRKRAGRHLSLGASIAAMFPSALRFAIALQLALVLGTESAAAQSPLGVKACLRDSSTLARTGDRQAAIDRLRDCSLSYPGEFALQASLGQTLAAAYRESGRSELAEAALAAFHSAAELEAVKSARLWDDLASMQQALGLERAAMSSWEQVLQNPMSAEHEAAADALWLLYREAAEVWRRYRAPQ